MPTLAISVLMLGCEEPFDPNAPFREELVIYSILSDISDVQYLRAYRTYDAPSFDPFEHLTDNGISGATVTATVEQSQVQFRDTLITRKDTSRYQTPIVAYVADPFSIQRGKTYTLDILTSDGRFASTSVTVPGQASMNVTNPSSVQQPSPSIEKFIVVRAFVPATAEGFLIRFFVNYEVFINGSWTTRRGEIPYLVMLRGEEQTEVFLYPILSRVPDPIGGLSTIVFLFSTDAYQTMVGRLRAQAGGPVQFNSAVFLLTSVEQNLYRYYNIVNGFQDPNSIRLDEPDFTNFSNAAGVLGAFVQDSVSLSLPIGF